jgi:hypothetical protein
MLFSLPPIPLKEKEFLDGWKKWLKKVSDALYSLQRNGLLTKGDVIIDNEDGRLIMVSPDGTYWLISIDNTGAIVTESITDEEFQERVRLRGG